MEGFICCARNGKRGKNMWKLYIVEKHYFHLFSFSAIVPEVVVESYGTLPFYQFVFNKPFYGGKNIHTSDLPFKNLFYYVGVSTQPSLFQSTLVFQSTQPLLLGLQTPGHPLTTSFPAPFPGIPDAERRPTNEIT